MSEATPFNPAQHGGVAESMRTHSRSGTLYFIVSLFFLVGAVLFFYFFFMRDTPVTGAQIGFWLCLVIGILLFVIGITNIMTAQAFTSRVNGLKREGLVVRGAITGVRHNYHMFGGTWGTSSGDLHARDSGWFFRVTYAFEDNKGRQRTATGIIQDPLGAKRGNTNMQSTFDPGMPRVGQRVDVLFGYDESVILRIVPAT